MKYDNEKQKNDNEKCERKTDIVVVSSQNTNNSSSLPIPDSDGLIIRSTQDPRVLLMEKSRSDVIQMTQQSEQTPTLFIIPELFKKEKRKVKKRGNGHNPTQHTTQDF